MFVLVVRKSQFELDVYFFPTRTSVDEAACARVGWRKWPTHSYPAKCIDHVHGFPRIFLYHQIPSVHEEDVVHWICVLDSVSDDSGASQIMVSAMDLKEHKLVVAGLLFFVTLVLAKIVATVLAPKSRKRLPPTVAALPVVGGLLRFMKGPIPMIREEYAKLGSVFTVHIINRKITFFIGPEVSGHFFKAPEAQLSQQEVYQFNVPTFGPGVVFDVDYSVRQEQFRFFTEALRVTKLRSYVDQMIVEAENRQLSYARLTGMSRLGLPSWLYRGDPHGMEGQDMLYHSLRHQRSYASGESRGTTPTHASQFVGPVDQKDFLRVGSTPHDWSLGRLEHRFSRIASWC
ncbi:hypothetical protein B296_00036207 [Ensete ventricosum]|uniref:Uncharacterized protein n=1 Tax=Ensete ventricosum TaxID=4639 RepID=A0A426ZUP3_ENSVE|nr:hypothetical protein B296_00036207 [Ensete ventricosum]